MTRTITAREATIKTAAVEVKALTISGRQVTLSVFRQLKQEAILDEDTADLRGVPWGIVNYFWGDCAKAKEHLHVVWQKGDELRRACVYPQPDTARGWRSRNQRIAPLALAFVLADLAERDEAVEFEVNHHYSGGIAADVFWRDRWLRVRIADNEGARAALELAKWTTYQPQNHGTRWDNDAQRYVPTTDEEHAARVAQAREERARPLLAQARRLTGRADSGAIAELVDEAVDRVRDFEERWREQYAALADLDHLFIAV